MMSTWQQQLSSNCSRLRPEPKRPGHTSFLLFIKSQITNIALFPLFLMLLEPGRDLFLAAAAAASD